MGAQLGCGGGGGGGGDETAVTETMAGSVVTDETSVGTTVEASTTGTSTTGSEVPTTGGESSTSEDPTIDPTTETTSTEPTDPCLVPARAFVGLGGDGRQFYDLPGRPPNGMTALRWAFAAPQIGIEVSEAGDLYAVEPTAEGWVLARYCYDDGAVVESIMLDLPGDRAITSFTWREQEIAVAVTAATPDTPAALHAVMPDGTLAELESLDCPLDDAGFSITDYNPTDPNVLALANQSDQYLRTPDYNCINYTGNYLDLGDGPEWYQWMDFDAASYDDLFEIAYDLYGLSPYGRLYLRGAYDAADPELVSEFPEPLLAFAIGPE